MKDMDRWLGNGGMPIIESVGASFKKYGLNEDGMAFCSGTWTPTELACNPHGTAQAGIHSLILDAAMNFAINANLDGKDRTKATIEMKTDLIRAAVINTEYKFTGKVIRLTKQIGFGTAQIIDNQNQIVSSSTGSFLLYRHTE
jgi:uncharacterized protein (TIGR00369 family)